MTARIIAVVADTHANCRDRWDEHCRIMTWIADDIATRRCDLVIHTGDIYDTISTPMERAFVSTWCQRICDVAPLAAVGGNHEQPGDVAALDRLRTRHPIVAREHVDTVELAGVTVGILPWPRTAGIVAAAGPVATPDADAAVVGTMRDELRAMGQRMATATGPRVLAAHVMIGGARTDHNQPLVGTGIAVSVEDLALSRADVAALGHVHAGQRWHSPMPAAYAGAPRHTSYGEPGPGKGYMLIHFDGATFRGIERVATPCRPMVLLTARYRGGVMQWARPSQHDIAGADVRLRYRVTAPERVAATHAAAEAKAWLQAHDAAAVKVEADVETAVVARAPAVAAAPSVEAAMLARWDQRGEHRDVEDRARLLGKFVDLEDVTI